MIYRNYGVENEAGRYVARSSDENDNFHMISVSLSRLKRAIDQQWETADQVYELLRCTDREAIDFDAQPLPGWIRTWVKSGCGPDRIDLDIKFATGQL
jgi:hypothetical protein